MSGARFSDLIKQYDGEGDFSEWLKKMELVCKLQKVKELESVLPLFLSGGAFAVYDGLSEGVKKDYRALTEALQQAFSANCFQAYEAFISRRLLPGESVDVYASEIKRLAKLVDPLVSEEWIKCAVVYGLPTDVQTQLKAACSLQTMELAKVIERARSLVIGREPSLGAVASRESKGNIPNRRKCFTCDKEGHLAWACPSKRRENVAKVVCYRCGEAGHYASKCEQFSKNE